MSAPQQTQWRDVQQVLQASGQPIQPVPFAQYVVHIGAVQGGALNFAAPGQQAADRLRPYPQPPRTPPRPVPGFLDRDQEQSQIGQALARRQAVDLHGPTGTGKTALIGQTLHGLPPSRFPDGTVYLRAEGEVYDDLLQDLLKQFYDIGKDPVHFTENEVRRHLAGKQALIAVDDADALDERQAEALLNVAPQCALLVAGHEQKLWQGAGLSLGGLPPDQAVALFERTYGRATPQDRPTVEALCRELHGAPKAILKTARMAAQLQVPLAQALQEVQSQAQQQDPLGQATWMLGLHLSEGERRTLAGLAAPGGPTVDYQALAYITQIADDKLGDYLARLQKMDLVHAVDSRYALDEGLRPHFDKLGVDEAMRARVAHYYLQQASQLRPRSKDPDEANVAAALDYFYQRGQWREVIQIARSMDRYLATSGRWGSWRQQLEKALHAARQVGDRATEAWAQNQLGIIAVGAGSAAAAQGLFRGALALWQALGDSQGATIARWNLQLLLAPPPPPHKAKPEGQPGGGSSPLPAILGGVAAVLVVTLIILIGVAIWPDRPTPPPPPPPATTRVPPTTVAPPPTTVVPPEVEIQLAAGCGETFAPGQDLGIQIWSSVDGSVDVSWVSPDGSREPLFDVAVRAEQTASRSWSAPEIEGRWSLEANLKGGQARDTCEYFVEIPIEPQVQVWLAEGCGATFDPGEAFTILVRANVDGSVAVDLVDAGGGRSLLFRENVQANGTVERSWEAPDREGAWTLEAVLKGEPASDECRFQVEAPEIRIELDGACGLEYEQGAEALVSLRSNRSGQVDVYLVAYEERQYLFSETVPANQTTSRYWNVGYTAGDWALEADLSGQATDRCEFAVANESNPPVIEQVWIEPVEDPEVCPGDKVWVYATVLDDSGLSRVELYSRPPDSYWFSAAMEALDDWTYRYPMIAYEKPGTDFYIYAEDVYQNAQTSAMQSYAVEPCPTVLYDFVEGADTATWTSYQPFYPYYYGLEFPGGTSDSQGFALWQYDATLEDGSQPDHRILETHPTWTDGGGIQGAYNLGYPVDIVIQTGDRFVARVGFLYGAGAGNVTFDLQWWNGDPDGPSVTLASLSDTYDGVVQDWIVPLDSLAGQSGYFYLAVEAGLGAAQDWAVWVEARLERP